jgi:hypothetical protein
MEIAFSAMMRDLGSAEQKARQQSPTPRYTMIPPRPSDTLAGCVWLPRILGKARLIQQGTLPPDYVAMFGHPKGVDGLFLAHFNLTKEDIIQIATQSDAQVAEWFLSRLPDSAEKIASWNHTALNLGRPGFPFADRIQDSLAKRYQRVANRGFTTIFEILEADDAMEG